MRLPTWEELDRHHCSRATIPPSGEEKYWQNNIYYEELSKRRYNYATAGDRDKWRFVFLKDVLRSPANKTLCRKGRFIWCRNLRYEGKDQAGLRSVSFTVDKGTKRFLVSENNLLCLPSHAFINNNRYFRVSEKTFTGFGSPFCYPKTVREMARNHKITVGDMRELLHHDDPFRPGTLVAPRLGYFFPNQSLSPSVHDMRTSAHPCGIVLGSSFVGDDFMGRYFYRVRFGEHTYESVHAVQMEIINEV